MNKLSDDNFLKDLTKSIKVPAELTKSALGPPSEQIGQGLGDLFYLAFSPIAKARIRKEHEIKLFRQEIESEIAKIPSNKIIEPPLNIVGPALEASKYYIEEDEIRSMFAKLIASSMDKEKAQNVHSSYIEIIKQLSPLDAKNFEYLVNTNFVGVGRIKTRYVDGEQGENTQVENFFPFPDLNFTNKRIYSSSIDNLLRLGLINIDHSLHFTTKSRYDELRSHPIYSSYKVLIEKSNSKNSRKQELFLKESIWSITDFGVLFSQCCL